MSHPTLNENLLLTTPYGSAATTASVEGNENAFTAELQHFSKGAAAAIQDLENWMALQENNNPEDNKVAPNMAHGDDGSDTSQDVSSLFQELQKLDELMRNDPETLSRELGISLLARQPCFDESETQRRGGGAPESAPPSPRHREPEPIRMTLDSELLERNNVVVIHHALRGGEEAHDATDASVENGGTKQANTSIPHKARSSLPDSNRLVLQFSGIVGKASRSVRTQQPLPRPHSMTTQQVNTLKQNKRSKRFWKRWLYKIKRGNKKGKDGSTDTNDDVSTTSMAAWVPFVQPFVSRNGSQCTTPRLISYYEVEILDPSTEKGGQATHIEDEQQKVEESQAETDKAPCIVIGMSTQEFDAHTFFPGWDGHSFGYHSDDGSLFYNRSRNMRNQGSPFGPGDVVGCGIDYRTSQVFYTFNGKFLGYSVTLNHTQLTTVNWYPTIGLDSYDLVSCNFGECGPFVYDLETMVEVGKQV